MENKTYSDCQIWFISRVVRSGQQFCEKLLREKWREMTQSYDNIPYMYTNIKFKKAKWQHKNVNTKNSNVYPLHNDCGRT